MLTTTVRDVLTTIYGTCVAFEHGARSERGGCGISHAHLHMVPVPKGNQFTDQLLGKHKFAQVARVAEIDDRVGGSPYLYIESAAGSRYVATVGLIPSQYLRRCLAMSLGQPSWDWRQTGTEESVVVCSKRLTRAFAEALD